MDPIVMQPAHQRSHRAPSRTRRPLEQYWTKMRQLRSRVDEQMLADHEIAVTWTAAEEQA